MGKKVRSFSTGGPIPGYSAQGQAEGLRDAGLRLAALDAAPTTPSAPAPLSTGSTDLDTLGTPQGSAPKFALQSFTDIAQAAGRDPNGAYRPGQVGDPNASGLGPTQQAAQSRALSPARPGQVQNQMTPVDSLFPSRKRGGLAAFAGGGEIKETPDQLIARMTGKYGTGPTPTTAVPAATAAPQPAPVQAAPSLGGLVGMIKGRKEQIDKAMAGYANGGKLSPSMEAVTRPESARDPRQAAQAALASAGEVVDSPGYAAAQFVPALNVPLGGMAAAIHGAQGRYEELPLDAASMLPGGKGVMLAKGAEKALRAGVGQLGRAANGAQAMGTVEAFGKNAYANGGKIDGPGTATSDSIPAEVKETGEPIAVSTGERIVSKAQDALLQKLARGMGYDSLDALLEQGTGKPVGPTMKGGMAHAATGAVVRDFSIPEDIQQEAALANANKVTYVPPPAAPINRNEILMDASARAADPKAAALAGPMVRPDMSSSPASTAYPPAAPGGDRGRGVPMDHNPPVQSAAGAPAPLGNTPNEIVQAGMSGQADPRFTPNAQQVEAPSGAVRGMSTVAAGQLQAPNGGGYITDANGRAAFLPGQAPAVANPNAQRDAHGNDMTYTNQMKSQLLQMERDRYGRDMGDDIKDPRVRLAAEENLARMNANQVMSQQAARSQQDDVTAGLEQQGKRQAVEAGGMTLANQRKSNALFEAYQAEPEGSPKKADLLAQYNALAGKADEYSHATGSTSIDPATGMAVKSGDVIYSKRTGMSANAQPRQDATQSAHADAKAALARGLSKDEVNRRLVAAGHPKI